MRIFVTGASGWIGSAVVPELLRAGHQVVGLARSDAAAAQVGSAGAEVLRGELSDLGALRGGALESEGVIHLAYQHTADFAGAVRTDRAAIEALGAALQGSGKPFVIASGTPATPGRLATEEDNPPTSFGPAVGRSENAQIVLGLADCGVRSAVVRIPRSVHGTGDAHGLIPQLIAIARAQGVAGYVGEGSRRWPAVYILDAARLFRLAVENAPAGSVLHAVGDEGVPLRDVAEVIGRHLGIPTGSRPAEDFGFLGAALTVDQPASSARTQRLLGWEPTGPGLIADLDQGHYFAQS